MHDFVQAQERALATREEITRIVADPNYWRVQSVLMHCYSCDYYACDVREMIAASDSTGKTAILAILAMYALYGESGPIRELGTRLSSAQA
jgi:hypothetical protein